MSFTCKHTQCKYAKFGKLTEYSCKHAGTLRTHHQQLVLHPCCNNSSGLKCAVGMKIRAWKEPTKPPVEVSSLPFPCKHLGCDLRFTSQSSRSHHHNAPHPCTPECEACTKRRKPYEVEVPIEPPPLVSPVSCRERVSSVLDQHDPMCISNQSQQDFPFDPHTISTAILIGANNGNQFEIAVEDLVGRTLNTVKTILPQITPMQEKFLETVARAIKDPQIMQEFFLLSTCDEAIDLFRKNLDFNPNDFYQIHKQNK